MSADTTREPLRPTGEKCPHCSNDKLVFRLASAHPRYSRLRRCRCCGEMFTVTAPHAAPDATGTRCECGHERAEHGALTGYCWTRPCQCAEYRPAPALSPERATPSDFDDDEEEGCRGGSAHEGNDFVAAGIVPDSGERATREEGMSDEALLTRVREIVSEMCKGDRWRMCVPAQPDDSDVAISELCDRHERVHAELQRVYATNSRNAELLREAEDELARLRALSGLGAARCHCGHAKGAHRDGERACLGGSGYCTCPRYLESQHPASDPPEPTP